jgi:hypothetical protein
MRLLLVSKYVGILTLSVFVISGCFLQVLIPAPDRSFTPQDILININDLPDGWVIMFGPRKVIDNTRSNESAEIAFAPKDYPNKRSITQEVFRYSSIQGARADFTEATNLPGETDIDGWSFVSDVADEQKISCYSYSNSEFPLCTYVARYQEFVIDLYARIGGERISIWEMEDIVINIDNQIQSLLNESGK